jgi:hypothetical protein
LSNELDANPVPHAPNHPAVSDNAVSEGHELKLIWQKAARRKLDRGAFFGNVDD